MTNFQLNQDVSDEDLNQMFGQGNPDSSQDDNQGNPAGADDENLVNEPAGNEDDSQDPDSKAQPKTDDEDPDKSKSDEEEKKVNSAYERLGLQKQFPKGATQALEAIPDFNRHLDSLNKAVYRLNRQNEILMERIINLQEARPANKIDPNVLMEKFATDPVNASIETSEQAGFVKNDKLKALEDRLDEQENTIKTQDEVLQSMNVMLAMDTVPELKNVVSAFRLNIDPAEGVNLYYDAMRKEYARDYDPETKTHHLYKGPIYYHILNLFNKIKPDVDTIMAFHNKGGKTPVAKVPDGQKDNANTSGASGMKKDKNNTGTQTGKTPDFSKFKSAQELKAYLMKTAPPPSSD